ncbi:hypothetical protein OG799_27080 [Micromonospora sp. NBC_00898]|uniref:hypothetical protein n=1 Tax=Micromonospora sp. NBC_00898 TaxID=2975981 RepID=UPI0038644450|nr:hypothetical protein OG799_27080 [Micromonospora sp. NBC_00898]
MTDAYLEGDPDGLSPLLVEIRDAVARELHAQFALRADRLELADLPEVAYQVTLRVDGVLSRRRPATGTSSVTGSPYDRRADRAGGPARSTILKGVR